MKTQLNMCIQVMKYLFEQIQFNKRGPTGHIFGKYSTALQYINHVTTWKLGFVRCSDSSSNNQYFTSVFSTILIIDMKKLINSIPLLDITNGCIELHVNIQLLHKVVQIFDQRVGRWEKILQNIVSTIKQQTLFVLTFYILLGHGNEWVLACFNSFALNHVATNTVYFCLTLFVYRRFYI